MIFSFEKSHGLLKSCAFCLLVLSNLFAVNAQTFPSGCGIGEGIPDNSCGVAPLEHNIVVSGVAGTQLGVDITLASVAIIVQHTFDADVEISLQSPGGVTIPLSIANGSAGANYGNPLDVTCTSVTTFSRNGINGPITGGTAPFIGSFIPQGNLDAFHDSTNPNGIWKLIICDNFPTATGALQFVSLSFVEPCEIPSISSLSTTSNSATVGWTSLNPGATYSLEYGSQGFTPGGLGSLGVLNGSSVSGNNSVNIPGLSPFTVYDIYLSEDCGLLQSDVSGPFSFTTNKLNDICAGAIPISCGDVLTDSTSAGATTTDAPAICGVNHNAAPGLWYVVTGNGMAITASTCGLNGYDTRIGVFEGPCLDLTCIAGNEDFCGTQSQVTFFSTIGIDYYIYVSGNTAQAGVFQLNVTCSANLVVNEVDYAQTGVDGAEFIEIKNAGVQTVSLSGVEVVLINGTAGGAVPYDTIALPGVNLAAGDYFVICGSAFSVANCDLEVLSSEWLRDGSPDAIAIYLGSTLLDVVSYNGNTGFPYTETSGVGLEDDSTISNIGIARLPDGDDSDDNSADFSQRCISPGVSNTSQSTGCTVSNDSCAHALVIDPTLDIPFDNTGTTTDGAGDALCFFGGSNQIYSDLWYSFTPACDGIATFSTVGGTSYDTRIAVYLNSCGGAIIECSDDSSALIIQSTITWTVTSGTTYLLRLGGFSNVLQGSGTFDLTLIDTVPPLITCGADKFKAIDPGTCSAVANPADPTASDNCGDVTLTNDFNGTASALGTYPVGTTTIIWTATDENGNTATCSQLVQITDSENPEITCPPNYTQLTDSGVCNAAVTIASPSVSDNCTITSVSNDFNGTPSATGTFSIGITTVIWTVTDSSGNINGCAHTITISDGEAPHITCPANLVIPACGSVATVPAPTTSDNCTVATLINDFNGTNNASGTYPLGVTTVLWTVADLTGNTATCSMTVTRNTPPTASITPNPAETCVLANLVLHGNPVVDSGLTAIHSWIGPIVGATNRDSVIFNLGLPGSYGPVIYRVTDANGCSASDTISVNVNPKPKANVPDVIEVCAGEVVHLSGNPSGGTQPFTIHAWTGDTASLNSVTIPNPDFVTTGSGTYNLTYTVTDSKNCSGSDNVSIIVNSKPAVAITPNPAEVCQNAPLTLDANFVSSGAPVLSQTWTGAVSKLSTTTAPVTNFNTSAPGIFNLTYTVIDNNLCSATDNVTVTVNAVPVTSFTGLQAAYCEDETPDTLTGTPTGGTFSGPGIPNGLPIISNYVPGPDTILSSNLNVFTQPVSVAGSSLGSDIVLQSVCFRITHPNVSDLDITLESPSGDQVLLASALCGTGDDMDVCIEIGTGNNIDLAACNGIPPALSGTFTAFTGEDLDSINDGTTNPNGNWNLLVLDNAGTDDGTLVSWSLNFEHPGLNVFNPDVAGTGNHTITYTFVDGNGCSGTKTQNVIVNPAAIANAGPNVNLCNGDSAVLTASGGTSYLWDNNATTASITVAPLITTTYNVTVTNSVGCADADAVMVFVNSHASVAFTGLDASYCLNGVSDTLDGTPNGGIFSGAGISTTPSGTTGVGIGDTVFIPSNTTTSIDNTVNGVDGGRLGVDVVLESVCLNIQHGFVNDLVIKLSSPGGVSVILTTQPCADNDDLDICIVPGTGNSMDSVACNALPPALSGTFTASSTAGDNLDLVNDGVTNPNGVWTLSVTDLQAGDEGNVLGFTLNFNSFGTTTFDPAVAGVGAHTVLYTFTDTNTCTAVDSMITNVVALPVASAPADTGICPGTTLTLTATGGIIYAWSSGSNADTTDVAPVSTTTYTVSVTDATGCSATDDVVVTVFPNPAINAGTDTTICSGLPTALTATGAVSYVWSTGDSAASVTVNPQTLSTYIVTGIDSNGCSGTDSIEVDINPLPVASPGPDTSVCIGDTVIITATGGNFYYWSDGAVTSVSGAHPVSPIANTVYTVIVKDGNGCADTTFVTVNVHPGPNVFIGGLDSVYCGNNNPVTLSGSPPNGTFTGPAITGNVFSPGLLAAGNYQIMYVYADSFGCSDTDSADVTIINAPAVSFSGLAPQYCPDTVAHMLVGNPLGGTFSGPGVSGNTSAFISFFAGPGTHDVIYTYFASGVCPGRDTQMVLVHTLPDARILDLDSVYCSADAPDTITGFPAGGTFSGSAMDGDVFFPPQVVTGIPSVVHYLYVDSNGCAGQATKITTVYPNPTAIIVNPGTVCVNDGLVQVIGSPSGGVFTGNGFNGNVLVTAVAGPGEDTITYTYTDAHGCAADTSMILTIYDVAPASFTGLDSSYCANEPVAVLTGTPAGGIYSGFGVGANLFDPAAAGTGGPYNVVYAFTDSNNCTATDTQTVSVINSPFAQIGGLNSFYCAYEAVDVPVNLFPTGGELAGAGISNGTFNPNTAGVGTHVISYKVTNAEGCSEIATVIVVVDACVGIGQPAVFASVNVYPNPSEGRFVVEIKGSVKPETFMRIYDLAGKMMNEERISETLQDYHKEFNLASYAKGVYYLRINFNEGVVVKKIVIE